MSRNDEVAHVVRESGFDAPLMSRYEIVKFSKEGGGGRVVKKKNPNVYVVVCEWFICVLLYLRRISFLFVLYVVLYSGLPMSGAQYWHICAPPRRNRKRKVVARTLAQKRDVFLMNLKSTNHILGCNQSFG